MNNIDRLEQYRCQETELQRSSSLLSLIPGNCDGNVLDVGARDGWFSQLLAQRFSEVTALDLIRPIIDHPKIRCEQGDLTDLRFPDNSYDLVFCAEVLEHIPPPLLTKACFELQRVSRRWVIVGVPYKQDIRFGRTNCYTCAKKNPPWGHMNTFDESRLKTLFPFSYLRMTSFAGITLSSTNVLSTLLMDFAGNPYGTYDQNEACVYCGARLTRPPQRTFTQKLATKCATYIRAIQIIFLKPHPNWIHSLFERK